MNAIGAIQQNATPDRGMSALSSDDFVKIIFAELGRQDPTQPTDTTALLQQLSLVRSIQSDSDLSRTLKDLFRQDEFASAAGLIGKHVSGVSDRAARVQGQVESVSRTSDGAVVHLQSGASIAMRNLDTIIAGE